MTYADKIHAPFCVLLGEDEIREGVLSVKNMETGEQRKLTADEAAEWILQMIREKNAKPVIVE